MKTKRMPLLGAIGISIIVFFLITINTIKPESIKIEENKEEIVVQEESQVIAEIEVSQEVVETPKPTPKATPKTTVAPTSEVTTQPSNNGTNLGQFRISAYCNCSKCCGKWAGGPTASGTTPTASRTIAVDPKVIPLGSKVIIDGHTYVAEDTGGAIKGNRIDMYFSSHSEALSWGVKYKNVSIVK